jgi:DnaJ-class molecular chaperone
MKKTSIAIIVTAALAALAMAQTGIKCRNCKGSGWDGNFKCTNCGGDGEY